MTVDRRSFLGGMAASLTPAPPASLRDAPVAGVDAAKLQPEIDRLAGLSAVPVRLRVWCLEDASEEQIAELGKILDNWDRRSDLDILWQGKLTVQQLEVRPGDLDALPEIRIVNPPEE
jgi:hypothetical protein